MRRAKAAATSAAVSGLAAAASTIRCSSGAGFHAFVVDGGYHVPHLGLASACIASEPELAPAAWNLEQLVGVEREGHRAREGHAPVLTLQHHEAHELLGLLELGPLALRLLRRPLQCNELLFLARDHGEDRRQGEAQWVDGDGPVESEASKLLGVLLLNLTVPRVEPGLP